MQFNKVLKGLAIALPVLALAACSSTKDEAAADDGLQTGGVDQMDTAGEALKKQLEAMNQDNLVYFDYDSSDIKAEYVSLVERHAEFLRNNPQVYVFIEGHTDERGTPEYNVALGERRANSVASYLQTLGVPAAQIATISYGEEKPVDPGHSESSWSQNRRAVLKY